MLFDKKLKRKQLIKILKKFGKQYNVKMNIIEKKRL